VAAGHLEALLNEGGGLALALLELPVAARGVFGLDAQPAGKMVAGGVIQLLPTRRLSLAAA